MPSLGKLHQKSNNDLDQIISKRSNLTKKDFLKGLLTKNNESQQKRFNKMSTLFKEV